VAEPQAGIGRVLRTAAGTVSAAWESPTGETLAAETFAGVDDAVAWARHRAPVVIVRAGHAPLWFSAGDEQPPGEALPPWPPRRFRLEGRADPLPGLGRRYLGALASPAALDPRMLEATVSVDPITNAAQVGFTVEAPGYDAAEALARSLFDGLLRQAAEACGGQPASGQAALEPLA
jgi:hypothetical protein